MLSSLIYHYVNNISQEYLISIFTTLTLKKYEGWNFNSGNYLFTADTK